MVVQRYKNKSYHEDTKGTKSYRIELQYSHTAFVGGLRARLLQSILKGGQAFVI